MDELIKRFDAATEEEEAAMLAKMTEDQKWELVAAMERQHAGMEAQLVALEAKVAESRDLPNLLRVSDANPFSGALELYQRAWQRKLLEDLPVSGLVN